MEFAYSGGCLRSGISPTRGALELSRGVSTSDIRNLWASGCCWR